MLSARNGHSATLLPGGTVLVVGGTSSPHGTSLASAEIYDPATNRWSAAASMVVARSHHAAALLANGKVLVVGGTYEAATVEIYDHATNTWTSVGSPNNDPRPLGPTATRLQDGRVMIVGGANGGAFTVNSDVWFFDPSTSQLSFSRFHPLTGGSNFASATLIADGTVLIAGGENSTTPAGAQNITSLFDPQFETCSSNDCSSFSNGAPMNVGHCQSTTTALKNGLLLVAGGRCGSAESIAACELYDPVAKKWWPAAGLQDPMGYQAAVLLNDGRVLVAGGIYPGGSISGTTEIYTPA
jgi:N-acetylneuraminic acid mutarotase